MQESSAQDDLLAELLELAGRLNVEVRRLPMGGAGGGLATLRGRRILFVDLDAPTDVQLDVSAQGLARLDLAAALEGVYIRPALRALLEGADRD